MEALSVEERLKRLGKENKRLRLLAWGVVVLAGGSLLLAASGVRARPPQLGRIVEAERFVLRDASGKPRAVLGMDADEPGLWLYDAGGKPRAALAVTADRPGLALYDASGNARAALAVTAGGPALWLYDKAGNVIWAAP
jgi:hypothetical protein